jgi:hypothetical protein
MQIGEPLRIIVVEPLEIPVNKPSVESEAGVEQPEPEQVPVAQ